MAAVFDFLKNKCNFMHKKQAYSSHIGLALHRSTSKWHAWFASRLSTWPTTGVSCPTPLGAQLTFRLAWCRQHSAAMATELLQPPDLACETLFQSSCVIPTSPTDCSDDSWSDTFFRKAWTRRSVTSAIRRHRQTLTYLLTDRQTFGRHADNGHFGDIPFGRPVLACSTFHCRPPNEGSVLFLI